MMCTSYYADCVRTSVVDRLLSSCSVATFTSVESKALPKRSQQCMLGIHGILEACRAVFNDCFTTARTLARVTGATCVSHEHLLVQTVRL
jgi:hypothetical protein